MRRPVGSFPWGLVILLRRRSYDIENPCLAGDHLSRAGSLMANFGYRPACFRRNGSHMTNAKVIMLIEAKIQPQRREELVEAARQYLPQVRAEAGVEAFYLTMQKDDPNTFVFYEIYKTKAAQDSHLQQDFTKKFLTTLKNCQVGERVRTNLVELGSEAPDSN